MEPTEATLPLFDEEPARPLADRLRPTQLEDVVGQDHLLAPDAPLGRMVAQQRLSSAILWGAARRREDHLARLLADAGNLAFEPVSATFSGVADLRKVFATARSRRGIGQGTLLFVDEIHRFNRAQQDSFLPYVEDGTVEQPDWASARRLSPWGGREGAERGPSGGGGHQRDTASGGRSARGLTPVRATARTLLPEVDHADRLPRRASNGFEVAVEVEQGEACFFRGCGHQEIDGARTAVFPFGGQLFLDDAGAAVDAVRHGAPHVVGVECSLQSRAVRS